MTHHHSGAITIRQLGFASPRAGGGAGPDRHLAICKLRKGPLKPKEASTSKVQELVGGFGTWNHDSGCLSTPILSQVSDPFLQSIKGPLRRCETFLCLREACSLFPHHSILGFNLGNMSFFTPAPEPPTELGRYRILSSSAGVRVSPLCLGAMSIGDAWSDVCPCPCPLPHPRPLSGKSVRSLTLRHCSSWAA